MCLGFMTFRAPSASRAGVNLTRSTLSSFLLSLFPVNYESSLLSYEGEAWTGQHPRLPLEWLILLTRTRHC